MLIKRRAAGELGKKGGYLLALWRDNSLVFEGCLELAVLTGSVEVHGFLLTPSHPPLTLFSPLNSPHLPIVPSPASQGELLGAGLAGEGRGLGADDVEWLKSLESVRAVCVVWNLDSPHVTCLHSIPNSGLLPSCPDGEMTEATFRLLKDVSASNSKLIHFPEEVVTQLSKVVDYRGPVVLVCGDINSGKSTLCRFLVNKFLNRYEKVGYLECDVGQPEFTVPMVTSLHLMTHPVFGPAHFGHRHPHKAYFFGELSPARKPRYYLNLIKQLYSLFMSGIHGNGEVPLIINTCGWTKYLGVALLMDIIRITSPSHIVRMVPDRRRVFNTVTDLLPFTPYTLTSTPGVLTPFPSSLPWSSEEHWYSEFICDVAAPQCTPVQWGVHHTTTKHSDSVTTTDSNSSDDGEPGTKQYHHRGTTPATEDGTDSSTEELVSDNNRQDEEVTEVSQQATPTLPSASPVGGVKRKRRRAQGHRSKVSRSGLCCLIPEPKYGNGTPLALNASSDHWEAVERQMIGRWVKVLDHQIIVQKLAGVSGARNKKKSSLSRRLSLMAHFAPLISGCGDHAHFLDSAPVMEVPWSVVALHVLHQQVPRSALMHAMVGCLVALCHINPCQVVEERLLGGGSVRFLRSRTPILEFLAMGILRGSSPEKQLFYVTTPLVVGGDVAMDTINILVLGEVSHLYGFSQTTPTRSEFRHIDIGQFVWKK